jgi:hypothetical protein
MTLCHIHMSFEPVKQAAEIVWCIALGKADLPAEHAWMAAAGRPPQSDAALL